MNRISLILFLLLFAACNTVKKTATVRNLDTITVSANNNPMNIYREAAARNWDILDTRVALTFNFKEKTANGRAWLKLQPYCCTQDSIVLDAKDMKIDTVAWQTGGKLSPLSFRYENDQLIIKKRMVKNPFMADAVEPVNTDRLYITYTAMPYADTNGGGSAAINEARGLYFINTDYSIPGKPVQIWTQGESESNSHWMPTIDKPNERFTTQIELTVPDSFQTLSNGSMTSTKSLGNGMRLDIWNMDKPIQTYAVMFAIGKYAIIKETWHNKEVSYYVEQDYAPYAKNIFQHTPEMLDYFSKITGVPYPWNKYSQVISRDYVSGAMENTSASLFGEFMNQTAREIEDKNNEDVVSHELFHQWFGDYVTFESWSNLTLSESFANYSEQLWRRHYYGDAWADELAIDDLNKYLGGSSNADPELVRFHYSDREAMFDHISYNKGGAILRYLHGLMGDDLFSLSMYKYLTKNALESAEATQWRLAVEEATGKDWNWFFNQWYYRAGHPGLDIKYNYNDAAKELVVTVRQRNMPDSTKLYQLPLKTGIINEGKVTIEDWDLKKRTETFTYKYQHGQKPVIVPDYYHWLPGEINENKKPAQWLAQLRYTGDYINKRRAVSNAFRSFADSSTKVLFKEALNDTISAIKVRALALLSGKPLQENLRQQVTYLAAQDGKNRVRAAAFDCLGEWKVSGAKTEMTTAIDDRSYAVSGAALQALYEVDKPAAYEKAKALLATTPRSGQERAVWSILSEEANEQDYHVFSDKANLVYGTRRIELAAYLSKYLSEVKDAKVFSDGLTLLDKLFHDEIILSYKKSIFSTAIQYLSEFGKKEQSKLTTEEVKTRKAAAKKMITPWLNDMPDKAINQERLDEQLK